MNLDLFRKPEPFFHRLQQICFLQLSSSLGIGGFSFFGAVGIFLVAGIGGQIFDSIGPTAPFTLVGIANLGLLALALLLLFVERRKDKN